MKNLNLILVCCLTLSFSLTYGQLSKEKKYDFLRNYKAPDFKQKRFNIGLNLFGGGDHMTTNITGRFSNNSSAGYSQHSNSQKYQGSFNTVLISRIIWNKSDLEEVFFTSNGLNSFTTSRFYFKPNWFIGVYGMTRVGQNLRNESGGQKSKTWQFTASPSIAIGSGRLEPIQYARNAMDIERQLKIGNRLSRPYTISQLNQIADRLAVINNVRFYDFRLRRIEQFEAIDATLREIGGVSEFDVAYFAHLADAYLYAQNFQRFSGFRNEVGVTNQFTLNSRILDGETFNSNSLTTNLYYSLSYNFAHSYSLQHTLFANVLGGFYQITSPNNGPNEGVNGLLNAGYELGLYPTTRTNFNFGVNIGADAIDWDLATNVYVNGSIYLSPQFRLAFEANYSPESTYVEPNYLPFPSVDGRQFDFVFGAGIRLTYAIF